MGKITKRDLIGIAFFGVLGLALFFFYRRENRLLEKHGVYILGRLAAVDTGSSQRLRFEYKYKFADKEYDINFAGPMSSAVLKDSLLFLRILPDNPEVCHQVQDVVVPGCLHMDATPGGGWKELPLNACK